MHSLQPGTRRGRRKLSPSQSLTDACIPRGQIFRTYNQLPLPTSWPCIKSQVRTLCFALLRACLLYSLLLHFRLPAALSTRSMLKEGARKLCWSVSPALLEPSREQCSKERSSAGLRQNQHSPVCTPGLGRESKAGKWDLTVKENIFLGRESWEKRSSPVFAGLLLPERTLGNLF